MTAINHASYRDDDIRSILNEVKTIAVVGVSPLNIRPSYFVFKYLAERGYDVIPVNPGHVGKELLGRPFVESLQAIERPVDMVDLFRNADRVLPAVEEALALVPRPKVIWMQLGVRHAAAAALAEAAGVKVVMDRCPKIEYARLSAEIGWLGVNSRTLSAKRRPVPTTGMRLPLGSSSLAGGTLAKERGTHARKSDDT